LDFLLADGALTAIRIGGREKCLTDIYRTCEIDGEQVMKLVPHAAVFRLTQKDLSPTWHRHGAAGTGNYGAFVPKGRPLAIPSREQQCTAPQVRVRFSAPSAYCGIVGFRASEMPQNSALWMELVINDIREAWA
jgi:hypothetical protein